MNAPIDTAESAHEADDLGMRIFRALKSAPETAVVDVLSSLAQANDVAALRVAMSSGLIGGEMGLSARATLACEVARLRPGADAATESFVTEWVRRLGMDDPDVIGSCLCLIDDRHHPVALGLLNANALAIASNRSGEPNNEGLTSLGTAFLSTAVRSAAEILAHLAKNDVLPIASTDREGAPVSLFKLIAKFNHNDPRLRLAKNALTGLFEHGVPASWSREIGKVLHDASSEPKFVLFESLEKRAAESLMMAMATMEDPAHWHKLLLCSRNRTAVDWLAADTPGSLATIRNLVRDGVAMDDLVASYKMFGECTVLHKAVEAGNLQAIELLLENGADPHAMTTRRNNQGEVLANQINAFDLAHDEGVPEAAQLLHAWQARQAVLATIGSARAAATLS